MFTLTARGSRGHAPLFVPLILLLASASGVAQSNLVAWGSDLDGQAYVPAPPAGQVYVEVAAGVAHTVARLQDGSVVAWGYNHSGQCNVPPPPAGESYVSVGAGWVHTVALVSDGSIAAWGGNYSGQCDVPAPPPGLAYVEVAAGVFHTAARLSDGSIVAWGYNPYGECDVPPPPTGLTYVQVAAGLKVTAARLSDGSALAWGDNGQGQCNVPAPPLGRSYVELEAHWSHLAALLSDGTLAAWGYNNRGQCNVTSPPQGLTYLEVAVGGWHTLARLSDGSLLAWGWNSSGQCNLPATPPGGFVQVIGGNEFRLARSRDPIGAIYCTAGTSSSGCQASISVAGSPSASSHTGCDLRAFGVQGGVSGLFLYGTNGKQAKPWGNGTSYRCVVPPVKRATRAGFMTGIGTSGSCDDYYETDLHELWTKDPAKNPGGGQAVQAQLWYRDPMNTSYRKTAFSDAVEFFVVP